MKAVVYRGPGQIACEEMPDPQLPPDGLILKVTACGICGGDLRAYKHGLRADKAWQILGHEIAGVVSEVGREVSDYRPGDRLAVAADVSCHRCYYCQHALYNLCENWKLVGLDYAGGMADYMLLSEPILRRGIVHRTPSNLPDIHATLAEPMSSVLWAQQTLNVQPGEVVVIFGDGPIGALHAQVARLRGAKPIVVGITGGRLDMFLYRDLGTWHVLNNETQDVISEVQRLTDGRGADVAIVAAPVKSVQAQALEIVRKRGRVGLFGGLPKNDSFVPLDTNHIHYNEISVIGNFSYHPHMHAIALDLLSRGKIEAEKIITATYPLEQVVEAFSAAMNSTELKVVLVPNATA